MTIAKLCKTILGITMMIIIFAYPISKNITNPEKVNSILNTINFESKFLDIFEAITISNLANQTGITEEAITEQISGDLISEEALRTQRIKAVDDFYYAIDNKQVPIIKFEVENPVSKFTDNLGNAAENFFDSITNIKLCSGDQSSFLCNTLCGVINCTEEEAVTTPEAEPEPNFVIETSLGISQENIEKVNLWYKILKYGPDILLVFSIALLVIGYISSFPSSKFALSMVWLSVQIGVVAFIFWAALPSIINLTTPIKIEPVTEVQGTVNNLIASSVAEISKEAFIIPVVFLVVNVLAFIGLLLIERYKNAQEGIVSSNAKVSYDVEDEKSVIEKESSTDSV